MSFCPYTFWQRVKWWWKVRTLSKEELAAAYRDAARKAALRAEEEFDDTYDDDTQRG